MRSQARRKVCYFAENQPKIIKNICIIFAEELRDYTPNYYPHPHFVLVPLKEGTMHHRGISKIKELSPFKGDERKETKRIGAEGA